MTKRLGRGLADLIETSAGAQVSNYVMLRADQIRAGRFQPRTSMNDAALTELITSIQRSGIIEPLIVRPIAHGTYELVAGERRFKAAQQLGMQEVPAIVRTLTDKEALEVSLVENVQRENLNPIDEANGYARLINEFGYTQETLSSAVGKNRATIANLLRVLTLPQEIRQGLQEAFITLGHAKALLSLSDRATQVMWYQRAIKEGFSVRQLEASVSAAVPLRRRRARRMADPQLKTLEDELRRTLGTKVSLVARKKGGRIIIEYFSTEDLSRLLQALGVSVAHGG